MNFLDLFQTCESALNDKNLMTDDLIKALLRVQEYCYLMGMNHG